MTGMTIFSGLMLSLFLVAQAAVDSGKQGSMGSTGSGAKQSGTMQQSQSQMQERERERLQERMHMQSSADLQLTDRVQQQLRTSIKNYRPNDFSIFSQNGEVTLEGQVRTRLEAEEMEREALRVKGVTRVQNNIVIQTE